MYDCVVVCGLFVVLGFFVVVVGLLVGAPEAGLLVVDLLTVGFVVAGLDVTGLTELGFEVGFAAGFLVVVPCFLTGFFVVVVDVEFLLYTTSFKPSNGSCNP
jgi:hypothetical protein